MNDMISWQAVCGDHADDSSIEVDLADTGTDSAGDDQGAMPVEIEHMRIRECGGGCRPAIALVSSGTSTGNSRDAFRAQVHNANPVVVVIADIQLAAIVDLYVGRVIEPGCVGWDVIAVIARNACAGNGRNTAVLGIDD